MESNKQLQRLANILIINAPQLPSNGLINGKMGAVLFFYQQGRKLNNPLYTEFADTLLDMVLDNLHISLSNRFTSGLTGLAWSLEYLIQKGFIEADSNDILEELDVNIFQLDKKKSSLTRIYDDYYGYGLYYVARASKDIHWNAEALNLLRNDLKALLIEQPLEATANYLISALYVIKELKRLGIEIAEGEVDWVQNWLKTNSLNKVERTCLSYLMTSTSLIALNDYVAPLALLSQTNQYQFVFGDQTNENFETMENESFLMNLLDKNTPFEFNGRLTELTWAWINLQTTC